MSSRFVKITCAAALALPLAAVAMPSAHAQTFPGENDCNHRFSGAVTRTPHTGDDCYGIDQRFGRPGPSGHEYVVVAIDGGSGVFTALCDNGDRMDPDNLDSAIIDSDGDAGNVFDSTHRAIGDSKPATTAFTLLCLDDHGRSHF